MTALEDRVIAVMAAHNHPLRPDDPPYPESLRPIARAVIAELTDLPEGATDD